MKSLLSLIASFLLIGVVFALSYAFYLGIFSSLRAERVELGPLWMVYEDRVGSYRGAGQSVSTIMKALAPYGVESAKGFGLFLDDPATVPEEKLRSQAGVVLSQTDLKRVTGAAAKYKVREFGPVKGYQVVFPFRNQWSISLGGGRAYPLLKGALGNEPAFALEIYDIPKTISYFVPLNEQTL